jgi:urease alpha subunit
MNESYSNENLQSLIKNRIAGIPFNSTLINSDFMNDILTHVNLIGLSSLSNESAKKSDSELEQYLQDLGVLSVISSSSFSTKNTFQTNSSSLITKTWQLANLMKRVSKQTPSNDNQRIKRYLAKYTINPALLAGCSHVVGSLEVKKMADLVLWKPEFFGIEPEMVIKGGQIVWSASSMSNMNIVTNRNSELCSMTGKSSSANSVLFISKVKFKLGFFPHNRNYLLNIS